MPLLLLSLIVGLLLLGGCDDDNDASFTLPPILLVVTQPANGTGTVLGPNDPDALLEAFNTLRTQAGVSVVEPHEVLAEAALRHVAYMTTKGLGLEHQESATTSPYYSGEYAGDRVISAALAMDIRIDSIWDVDEGISANAGTEALHNLWNTVYHRLPMMRHRTFSFGYADLDMVRRSFPDGGIPDENPTYPQFGSTGHGTVVYGISRYGFRSLSFWPADGQNGVPTTFDTNSETPDPLPYHRYSGAPIHVIHPVESSFDSLDISLRVAGTEEELAVHTLTEANDPHGFIRQGELFILPAAPLREDTAYTVSVSASAGGVSLPALTWSFATGTATVPSAAPLSDG